jgi:hypothetical protein
MSGALPPRHIIGFVVFIFKIYNGNTLSFNKDIHPLL